MHGMTATFAGAAPSLTQRVAAEVRAFMGRHGLTQARLAELLDWKQQYLSRRLTGSVAFDTNDLEALAEVFKVQPETFFRGPRGKQLGAKFVHWLRIVNGVPVITRMSFYKPVVNGVTNGARYSPCCSL